MIDPRDSKTTGYHLFLEPEGALREELSALIRNLAGEYGGPVFAPHVTLLARIPVEAEEKIIEKAQSLAKLLTPLTLTLGDLAAEERYYRALYIKIKEVEEMEKCHAQANETFSMQDEAAYLPHLSLLYGNYPQEKKEATMQVLQFPRGASFSADRLHLYRTEGEVGQWYEVGQYALGA